MGKGRLCDPGHSQTNREAAWQTSQSVQHSAWKDSKIWSNLSVSERTTVASWNINNTSKHYIGKGCEAVTVSHLIDVLILSLLSKITKCIILSFRKRPVKSDKNCTQNLQFQVGSETCERAAWTNDTVHTHLVLSWPDWLPLTLEKAAPFYQKTKQKERRGRKKRTPHTPPQVSVKSLLFLTWHSGEIICFMVMAGVMPLVTQLQHSM